MKNSELKESIETIKQAAYAVAIAAVIGLVLWPLVKLVVFVSEFVRDATGSALLGLGSTWIIVLAIIMLIVSLFKIKKPKQSEKTEFRDNSK